MPHAVFGTGPQTAAVTSPGRELIPGVMPGGQFAGKAKPALLLSDVNVFVGGFAPDAAAAGEEDLQLYLTLSQEIGMVPHLLIPLGYAAFETSGANSIETFNARFIPAFHAQGTIWAPRFVGWRTLIGGVWTNYDFHIHIDYERVSLPWRDWFVHWELLDGMVTGTTEY